MKFFTEAQGDDTLRFACSKKIISGSVVTNLFVVSGLLHQVQDLGGENGIGQRVGLGVDFSIGGLEF